MAKKNLSKAVANKNLKTTSVPDNTIAERKKAEVRKNLKTTSILDSTEKPNLEEDGKKIQAISYVTEVIMNFNKTNKPIKRNDLRKIIQVANEYNILLQKEVISAFNKNRENVNVVIPYFEDRLFDLFEALDLVSKSDELAKVKVMNLCVKIKKNKFQPPLKDKEVQDTKLFFDADCVTEACKLYIWYVKTVECEGLNGLDPEELEDKYTPIVDRYCRIANAPIKNPPVDEELILARKERKERRLRSLELSLNISSNDSTNTTISQTVTNTSSGTNTSKSQSDSEPSDLPQYDLPASESSVSESPTSESPASDSPVSDLPPSESPPSDLPPSDLPPSESPPPSELPPSELPPSESSQSQSKLQKSESSQSKSSESDLDDLPKYDIPESTDEGKTSTKNISEDFTEDTIDLYNSSSLIEKFTNDDYFYVIKILFFILSLFFIYIRYSK